MFSRRHSLEAIAIVLSLSALPSCSVGAGNVGGTDMATDGRVARGSDLGAPSSFSMFITSAQYDGNLGGLAGGDSKCAQAALAGSLSGRFIAWLSADSSHNAIDRVTGDGPWYAIGPSHIELFGNKANLTSSPLVWGQGATSVITDEKGRQANSVWTYWTGTDNGGVATAKTCGGWTDNTADGLAGKIESAGYWTNGGSYYCGGQFSLLCVQILP
jgi:hypothetical protein